MCHPFSVAFCANESFKYLCWFTWNLQLLHGKAHGSLSLFAMVSIFLFCSLEKGKKSICLFHKYSFSLSLLPHPQSNLRVYDWLITIINCVWPSQKKCCLRARQAHVNTLFLFHTYSTNSIPLMIINLNHCKLHQLTGTSGNKIVCPPYSIVRLYYQGHFF